MADAQPEAVEAQPATPDRRTFLSEGCPTVSGRPRRFAEEETA
jgi:hypothetical protein